MFTVEIKRIRFMNATVAAMLDNVERQLKAGLVGENGQSVRVAVRVLEEHTVTLARLVIELRKTIQAARHEG